MMATRAASTLWSLGTAGMRALQRAGWLRATSLEAGRTLSVGNLQAGGAGKTPLVARLAREGLERGLSVCILSRGYGSQWERSGGVVSPEEPVPHPDVCGDEPALLRERAPGAWLAVGRDRISGYRSALERKGGPFDLVILDDGFQHWRIRKDLEIVALTSHTPSTRLHRDFSGQLRLADLAVWTKGADRPDSHGVPLVQVRNRLVPLREGKDPGNRRVWLVSGLADPGAFERDVGSLGFDVVHHSVFPDHFRFGREEALEIQRQAHEARAGVAMSGKDWVKWRTLPIEGRDEVRVFEPELEWVEGESQWRAKVWGESC